MYSLQESAKRLNQLRKTKNVTQEHVAIVLGVVKGVIEGMGE